MLNLLFAGDFRPTLLKKGLFSEDLCEIIEGTDFFALNLEAPITDSCTKISKTGSNFKIPLELIDYINFDCLTAFTLSNNHIRDYGCQGVKDTLNICRQKGIQTIGAGLNINEAKKPLIIELMGKKLCLLNYSEKEFNSATINKAGANGFDIIDAIQQIKEEKRNNDFVIVIYHGGIEYHHLPTPEIVKLFKFLIDIDVDVVISHHTHRYSGVSYYNNKPIIYGLGNLLAPCQSKVTNDWLIGVMAKITFSDTIINTELIPTKMCKNFFSVDTLKGTLQHEILNHLKKITDIIENENQLYDYWEVENEKEISRLANLIKSDSILEYRLRKYLPSPLKSNISSFKLKNIMNLLRCTSLRDRSINVLDYYIKKRLN